MLTVKRSKMPKIGTTLPPIVTKMNEMKDMCISSKPMLKTLVQEAEEPASAVTVIEFRESMTNNQMAIPFNGALGDSKNTNATRTPATVERAPKGMTRAKYWTPDIENSFRFQEAGYRDFDEYHDAGYETPDLWPTTGFVKCLRSKKTGFFLYFRQTRECHEKHVNKIKIYTY